MFTGRKKELGFLEEHYGKGGSQLLVVYGHKGVGKTSLALRFARNKSLRYYIARACSEEEQRLCWQREVEKLPEVPGRETLSRAAREKEGFESILCRIAASSEDKPVIVIDEFQNIIKYSTGFMPALSEFLKKSDVPCLVLLLSSSISFVETDFVPRIGALALGITAFYKLPELGFMDCVNFFKDYTTRQCMEVYSLLGGIPAYWNCFRGDISVEENIKKNILAPGCLLREEAERVVAADLRELNVYCTLLGGLSDGKNKLNDLHLHTGFSRAKISVYLKNLMERELVEKVFPFDNASSINAKKGIYRMELRLLEFYFRFMFKNLSALEITDTEEFYAKYVAPGLDSFHQGNFRKVCGEYLDILNQNKMLPFVATRNGEWVGKEGSIDIVMQDDDWESLLAFCNWELPEVGEDQLKKALKVAEAARLHPDHLYMFAAGHFSQELKAFAEANAYVTLIDIDTL